MVAKRARRAGVCIRGIVAVWLEGLIVRLGRVYGGKNMATNVSELVVEDLRLTPGKKENRHFL